MTLKIQQQGTKRVYLTRDPCSGRIGVALQVTVENTERRGVICDLVYSKIFTVDTLNRPCFTVEKPYPIPDQIKIGKVSTRFQTKTAQKPYPMGRHKPI